MDGARRGHLRQVLPQHPPELRLHREASYDGSWRVLGQEITPALLERYHSLRMGQRAAKGTADLALRVLCRSWNWGLENRLLTEVWPKPSLRLRDRTKRDRPSSEEIKLVLATLRRDAPQWCWRLAYVLAQSGMRVSEAWGLKVEDVAFNKEGGVIIGAKLQIRDQVGVAKTGARPVWIASEAAREVERWIQASAPGARLIGKVTQKTATMGAANYLRPAVQSIGGEWTGWHSFRRAAADSYAEAGADPVVAAAQMGHTVQVMQSIYRTVRDEQAQAAAAAVADLHAQKRSLKAVEEG